MGKKVSGAVSIVLVVIAVFAYQLIPKSKESWREDFQKDPQAALVAIADEVNRTPSPDPSFALKAYAEPNLTLQFRQKLLGLDADNVGSIKAAKFSRWAKRFFCKEFLPLIRPYTGDVPIRYKWGLHDKNGKLVANIRISEQKCGYGRKKIAKASPPDDVADPDSAPVPEPKALTPEPTAPTPEKIATLQSKPETHKPAEDSWRPPAELKKHEGQMIRVRLADGSLVQGEHYGQDSTTLYVHVARGATGFTSKVVLTQVKEFELLDR